MGWQFFKAKQCFDTRLCSNQISVNLCIPLNEIYYGLHYPDDGVVVHERRKTKLIIVTGLQTKRIWPEEQCTWFAILSLLQPCTCYRVD